MAEEPKNFEDIAKGSQQSFVKEVWHLLTSDRRWWLAPIVVAIVILGALVLLSSTGAAPFIYTLF